MGFVSKRKGRRERGRAHFNKTALIYCTHACARTYTQANGCHRQSNATSFVYNGGELPQYCCQKKRQLLQGLRPVPTQPWRCPWRYISCRLSSPTLNLVRPPRNQCMAARAAVVYRNGSTAISNGVCMSIAMAARPSQTIWPRL